MSENEKEEKLEKILALIMNGNFKLEFMNYKGDIFPITYVDVENNTIIFKE